MDDNAITAEWSVDVLLTRYQQAAKIFVAHHMACVGCSISGFHTVAEVAALYRLDVSALLQELQCAILEFDNPDKNK
jgi:hybrid cluster-associated redox disulfide protein